MKSYIRERPPGWSKKPDQPVIIVTGAEETTVRKNTYMVSDFWRRVRHRADQILNRNSFANRVDICSVTGEVIRIVKRSRPEEGEPVREAARSDDRHQAAAKEIALAPLKETAAKIAATGATPPKTRKAAAATSEPKKLGRPSGKRSDPDFTQITAYIRKDTLKAVKLKLLQQDENKDVSELIETLLSQWRAQPSLPLPRGE